MPYITRKILIKDSGNRFLSRWLVFPVLNGCDMVEIRAIGQAIANQRLNLR